MQYDSSKYYDFIKNSAKLKDAKMNFMEWMNKNILPADKKFSTLTISDELYKEDKLKQFKKSVERIYDVKNAKKLIEDPVESVMRRCYGELLDLTPGKKGTDANKEFFKKYNNAQGAKDLIQEKLVEYASMDVSSVIIDDYNTMYENYMKDPAKYAFAFQIESGVRNQKLEFKEPLDKVYDNMKTFLEAFGQPENAYQISANPMNLLLPTDPALGSIIVGHSTEIIDYIKNDPEFMKYFDEKDLNAMVSGYGSALYILEEHQKDLKAQKELEKKCDFKGDFFFNKSFTLDGKDLNYQEAILAQKEGKNVKTREFSEKEKALIKDALYNNPVHYKKDEIEKRVACGEAILDKEQNFKAMDERLKSLNDYAKTMDKTNYVFSRDTREFKDLNKVLNTYTKNYEAFQKQLKEELKTVSEAEKINYQYEKTKEYMEKNKPLLDEVKSKNEAYFVRKTEKNKAEKAVGKEYSQRTVDRYNNCIDIRDLLKNELEPIYKDAPEAQTRIHVPKDAVEKVINGDKEKELQVNKDLAQEKEVEKEMERVQKNQ